MQRKLLKARLSMCSLSRFGALVATILFISVVAVFLLTNRKEAAALDAFHVGARLR